MEMESKEEKVREENRKEGMVKRRGEKVLTKVDRQERRDEARRVGMRLGG